ncbi:unnamed protein product [Prunus armeniaca]
MAMKMMLCNTFFFSLHNPIEPISMAGRNKDILNNQKLGCDFGRWGCRVMRWGGGWWVVVSQQQREIKGEGERVWVVVEMGL